MFVFMANDYLDWPEEKLSGAMVCRNLEPILLWPSGTADAALELCALAPSLLQTGTERQAFMTHGSAHVCTLPFCPLPPPLGPTIFSHGRSCRQHHCCSAASSYLQPGAVAQAHVMSAAVLLLMSAFVEGIIADQANDLQSCRLPIIFSVHDKRHTEQPLQCFRDGCQSVS